MPSEYEEIFSGNLLRLIRKQGKYECVEHPGAVAVLPILSGGDVILIRQYRPAINREILELPAGLLEPGEEPIETGKRELLEETGYHSDNLEFIFQFYSSPGFTSEKLFLFRARDLEYRGPPVEQGLELVRMNRAQVSEGLFSGLFDDAKTIIGLQFYLQGGAGS